MAPYMIRLSSLSVYLTSLTRKPDCVKPQLNHHRKQNQTEEWCSKMSSWCSSHKNTLKTLTAIDKLSECFSTNLMGFIMYYIKDILYNYKGKGHDHASIMRIIYRRRGRCEVCSTAAGVEVLGWCQSCSQAVQNPSSVSVPRVPMSWAISLRAPNRSLSLRPSLRTLFPFDHIPAKACSAIYSRVVLFYPPVSICSALKYRGLPACWRQQCRAAEGWLECGRGKEKETQTERNWMIQKGIGLKDARRRQRVKLLHKSFGERWQRFISVCSSKLREQSLWLFLSSSPVMDLQNEKGNLSFQDKEPLKKLD